MRRITQGVAQAWYSLGSLHLAGPQRITPKQLQQLLQTVERNGGTALVAREQGLHGGHPQPVAASQSAEASDKGLRMGTDYSGMDMAAYAMKQARIRTHHLFATESDPKVREHLARNHQIEAIYEDIRQRPVEPLKTATKRPHWQHGP